MPLGTSPHPNAASSSASFSWCQCLAQHCEPPFSRQSGNLRYDDDPSFSWCIRQCLQMQNQEMPKNVISSFRLVVSDRNLHEHRAALLSR
jgi:hypothetical protein